MYQGHENSWRCFRNTSSRLANPQAAPPTIRYLGLLRTHCSGVRDAARRSISRELSPKTVTMRKPETSHSTGYWSVCNGWMCLVL